MKCFNDLRFGKIENVVKVAELFGKEVLYQRVKH